MIRAAGVVALALTACLSGPPSSDDPLDRTEDVQDWARRASALGIFTHGANPLEAVAGLGDFVDPACPVTSDDGTTYTVEGGCTDVAGQEWVGWAQVVRGDGGDLAASYEGFGDITIMPELMNGTIDIDRADDTHASYQIDAVWKSDETSTEVAYSGDLSGDAENWISGTGSGTFVRSGGDSGAGLVEAETDAELIDYAICDSPASGSTTLVSPDHTIVITYDGATDCDPDHAARWTVDGEDRGLLSGVTCSIARGRAAPSPLLLLAIAVLTRPRRWRTGGGPGGRRARTRRSRGWRRGAPWRRRGAASSRGASARPRPGARRRCG
jgi:hypothetical protein